MIKVLESSWIDGELATQIIMSMDTISYNEYINKLVDLDNLGIISYSIGKAVADTLPIDIMY